MKGRGGQGEGVGEMEKEERWDMNAGCYNLVNVGIKTCWQKLSTLYCMNREHLPYVQGQTWYQVIIFAM